MIVSNARAKPLDPSLPQGYGIVPTGAKVGIDATIPENIPREYYERITPTYAETAKIDDYVNGKKDAAGEPGDEAAVAALAEEIAVAIGKRRCTTPILRRDSPNTISPAPSGNCTKLKSSGRTRADACACAARRARQSRLGSEHAIPTSSMLARGRLPTASTLMPARCRELKRPFVAAA